MVVFPSALSGSTSWIAKCCGHVVRTQTHLHPLLSEQACSPHPSYWRHRSPYGSTHLAVPPVTGPVESDLALLSSSPASLNMLDERSSSGQKVDDALRPSMPALHPHMPTITIASRARLAYV